MAWRRVQSGEWNPSTMRRNDFLSTAAVWCVPFCLDCSVPSVYSINYTNAKKEKNRPETAGGAIPAQVTYTLCTTYTTRHPCFAAGNRTSRPFNTLFDLQQLECRNSSTHNHIKSHLHDVNHPRVRWPRSGLNALCGATHEGGRCGRHRRGTMRPCNCARRAARVAKRRCERLTRTPTLTTDPSL